MVDRYYSQHTEVSRIWATRHTTAWQVFDRDQQDIDDHNLPKAIALCCDRKTAFLIRDTLNKVSP